MSISDFQTWGGNFIQSILDLLRGLGSIKVVGNFTWLHFIVLGFVMSFLSWVIFQQLSRE